MLKWPLPTFKGSPKIRASRTSGAPQYSFAGFPLAGLGITTLGVPILRGGTATDTINDSSPAAIPLTTPVSLISMTGSGNLNLTLADGVAGQEKTLILIAKSGTGNPVITPANFHGYTNLTMRNAGAVVVLRFEGGEWGIVGMGGKPDDIAIDTTDETITGAGALTPNRKVTRLQTSSGVDVAITLANMSPSDLGNFEKLIYMETKGGAGNYVLTPTALMGYTTITFNTIGDAVLLRWGSGIARWIVASNQGCTLA